MSYDTIRLKDIQRQTDRQTDTDRGRDRERVTERQRESETEADRNTDRQRQTETHTETEAARQKHRRIQRQRERRKETNKPSTTARVLVAFRSLFADLLFPLTPRGGAACCRCKPKLTLVTCSTLRWLDDLRVIASESSAHWSHLSATVVVVGSSFSEELA